MMIWPMMTLIAVNEHCKYDSIDDTSLYVDKETEIQTHSANAPLGHN